MRLGTLAISILLLAAVLVAGGALGTLIIVLCSGGDCVGDWRTWWLSYGAFGTAAIAAACLLWAGARGDLLPERGATGGLGTGRTHPTLLAILCLAAWMLVAIVIAVTGGIGN